ncbi:MAG TPA: response regulator transcription factor [Chroococcales cyanobacterium]
MNLPEKNILVVDDEEQIRRALKSILTIRKYRVLLASSGEEALDLAIDTPPDLVILDLSLPGIGGVEVCRELRTWLNAPILILSVKSNDSEKISALDSGADDYLTKPFSAGELLARIRALLRRSEMLVVPIPVIQAGELEIDLARRLVSHRGQGISLTPIEYGILTFLAQNANCVVTSKMLIESVWGEAACEDTQALRVHVSHLRKKIEANPHLPQRIITEPGIGFRFSTS